MRRRQGAHLLDSYQLSPYLSGESTSHPGDVTVR